MSTNKLHVMYLDKKVGTLALTVDKKIAFQYDEEWLKNGFSISPFSLPLKKEVFISKKPYFNGLFGIFSDSLPDAWGNILLNRILKKYSYNPNTFNILDRLAIIGNSGMGALSYISEIRLEHENKDIDLDTLFQLGGSSGGTRPKILTTINDENWIIKFPAPTDSKNIGLMEYEYSLCVKDCGIKMSDTRLFPSKISQGYFGTKRFDRQKGERYHMATVAALLEVDFRHPSLDYHSLMKLTKILTRDNPEDIEQLFRIACFNVFAHNRDDHAKNFSFLYDQKRNTWRLSPAYDMTYTTTYYGEHTISVDNNGANPGKKELLAIGIKAGMKKSTCEAIINEIELKVRSQLKHYL